MENPLEIVNTTALVILGALFFFQRNKLQYMETAMKAIDVKKIVESQEYILKSEKMRIEDDARNAMKQHELNVLQKLRRNESNTASSYDELFSVVFQLLAANDIKYQEKALEAMPSTAPQMRRKLAEYSAGLSDVVQG